VRAHRLEKLHDRRRHVLGRFHELDPRPVDHHVLIDVADLRVHDAAFHHDRTCTQREPQIVKGVEMQGEAGLDKRSADTDLADQHRLEHHDLALQEAQHRDALSVALLR
jgi:hypothetical protein